ncbi:MAG: hypothetical protein A2Y13_04410 [Planctomycetes bacterium GWC2_45_44]|nr:MAG: hypothetical protein A2Y13_04410 [Planctomycetes bacterium GWC2_45_44]HBR19432.1 hypothetical protein [Phycisphaerales bacterium]
MAYKEVIEDIRTCVNLGIPKRIPVFGIGIPFNIKMAGVTHRQYTNDIDVMVKTEVGSVRKYDYDWATPFSDDFIEIEPLGVETTDDENVPIAGSKYLLPTWETVKKLKIPDCRKDGRMSKLLEVQSKIKKILGDTVCQIGHVASPFSAASLIFGVEETLMLIHSDPDLLKKTIEFCIELESQWGKAQIEAGADAIWLGDCVASSSFISPQQYTEFAADAASKVCKALKKENGFVFYHSNEHSLEHLKIQADLSFSTINIGEDIDIAKVKEAIGKKVCIMGNIDPIKILWQGKPEDVERETRRIIDTAGKSGGFIFNSGEGIVAETPEINLKTMIQTVKRLGGTDTPMSRFSARDN